VFSHGWPLSADDWDAQMLFFLKHGYRVIDTPRATASPASAIPDSSRWVRSWSTRPSSVNRKLWDRRSISLTPGLYARPGSHNSFYEKRHLVLTVVLALLRRPLAE
jgi:hypothetical protein